jgi:endonuclease/exonuclease/phosphatase (EEP) superfamily protein YafD
VEENTAGLPTAVKLKRRQNIIDVEDCWRIDDEWWRSEPVSRLYYVVILSSGQRVVLAKNLVDNCWYRQSY